MRSSLVDAAGFWPVGPASPRAGLGASVLALRCISRAIRATMVRWRLMTRSSRLNCLACA